MYDFHHYITLHVPIQENIEIHDEPRHVDTVAVTITRIFEWQKVSIHKHSHSISLTYLLT